MMEYDKWHGIDEPPKFDDTLCWIDSGDIAPLFGFYKDGKFYWLSTLLNAHGRCFSDLCVEVSELINAKRWMPVEIPAIKKD